MAKVHLSSSVFLASSSGMARPPDSATRFMRLPVLVSIMMSILPRHSSAPFWRYPLGARRVWLAMAPQISSFRVVNQVRGEGIVGWGPMRVESKDLKQVIADTIGSQHVIQTFGISHVRRIQPEVVVSRNAGVVAGS